MSGENRTSEVLRRFKSIEKKLDDQSVTLRGMADTISRIAVQDEKIIQMQGQVAFLWSKWDSLTDPKDGAVPVMQRHQASCPRTQLKWLWSVVISMNVLLLGVGFTLLSGLARGAGNG